MPWNIAIFIPPYLNFNQRVLELARSSGLPLLGNSDAHFLEQLGTTFSLIEAPKDMESIFSAIRQGKAEVVTKPLSILQMGSFVGRFLSWKIQGEKIRPL